MEYKDVVINFDAIKDFTVADVLKLESEMQE